MGFAKGALLPYDPSPTASGIAPITNFSGYSTPSSGLSSLSNTPSLGSYPTASANAVPSGISLPQKTSPPKKILPIQTPIASPYSSGFSSSDNSAIGSLSSAIQANPFMTADVPPQIAREISTNTNQPTLSPSFYDYTIPAFNALAHSSQDIGGNLFDTVRQQPPLGLRPSETPTASGIAQPPPPPPRPTAQPPPSVPDFITPSQDIQPSAVRQQLNPSLADMIKASANKPKKNIDEMIAQNKQEQKKQQSGIFGSFEKEIEKRRQIINPKITEDEYEDDEWLDEPLLVLPVKAEIKNSKKLQPIEQESAKPVQINNSTNLIPDEESSVESDEIIIPDKPINPRVPLREEQKLRKPGSGRPKGSGNKSNEEKLIDLSIKDARENLKRYKRALKELQNGDFKTDAEFIRATNNIERYEQLIDENETIIYDGLAELERLKMLRVSDF